MVAGLGNRTQLSYLDGKGPRDSLRLDSREQKTLSVKDSRSPNGRQRSFGAMASPRILSRNLTEVKVQNSRRNKYFRKSRR